MHKELPTYRVLRCPYCKYVWSKRGENLPVSCPRCKKRFDYPADTKTLEEEEELTDDIKGLLADANRVSLQCSSLDETMDKLAD